MNIYILGSILNQASLLSLAACGALISMKAGHFNLGGEGQVYAGGFSSAVLFVFLGSMNEGNGIPAVIAWLICFFVSGITAGILSLVSVLMKRFRGVEVLLSSFLMSSFIIPVIDSLIAGPFRGLGNNLLATAFVPEVYRFRSILKPSVLNGSAFVAVLFCILFYFFIKKSFFGKEICVFGISENFAVYKGFSSASADYFSVCVSGFMHGVTGMFAVAGTYFTCHSGFYSGYGWNALSVALIAVSNPLLIIPAALLIAGLNTGAGQYALLHNFGFDIASLIQALVMFVIVLVSAFVSSDFFKNYTGKIQKAFWGKRK
ncbi:MAG: ABC transporter permease [Treponema sp.]|nr:ABC transporter permease [Treponema sp.]